ncbi:MAG: cupin domain-containing protein [Opitutus sp.]|nr:cupin domain-containing protein [Opitutus sp.]
MKSLKFTPSPTACVAVLAGLFVSLAFAADAPAGFSRKVLQDQDISVAGHHAVVAQIDLATGASAARHTHPGEELGYVVEGTVVLEIDGKPAQTLKAGDSFFVPAGAIHAAKNGGNVPAKVVSSYVLEKGKPLATPATK